jgi:hypothetical protein
LPIAIQLSNGGTELQRPGGTKRNPKKWELNPGSIPKVAPTGIERTNPIKGMAENIELSRHSSRQFESDNIGLL